MIVRCYFSLHFDYHMVAVSAANVLFWCNPLRHCKRVLFVSPYFLLNKLPTTPDTFKLTTRCHSNPPHSPVSPLPSTPGANYSLI